jgi:two-component system sensor histidine kinase SenX3
MGKLPLLRVALVIAMISHELRTPLNAIKGYCDLLLIYGPLSEKQSDFVNHVLRNANTLSKLIEEVLFWATVERGELFNEKDTFALTGVIESVIEPLQTRFAAKKHQLTVAIPQDLVVIGDSTRFTEAFSRLIENAFRFTREEGIITVSASRVQDQWTPESSAWVAHVQIQDTGVGIAANEQDRIFDAGFHSYRSWSYGQDEDSSLNLGFSLNIVKGIVEHYGGRIWVESEIEKGSNFHVTIPVP